MNIICYTIYEGFKFLVVLVFLFLLTACEKSADIPVFDDNNLVFGVDISEFPAIEKTGQQFYDQEGNADDFLSILKSSGVNTIRLRLWVDPLEEIHSLGQVIAFADRLRGMGFRIWLTLHYSDTWADPGHQIKPKRWENLSFNALKDSVYSYTSFVVKSIQPVFIQTGNEINNGLLHPEGNRWQNPDQMLVLLQSANKAVRDVNPETKIITHYAGYEGAERFYEFIQALDYDIIGLSYYPLWHGKSLSDLEDELKNLEQMFGKDILIAETAYPFTLGWNDQTSNIVGLEEQLILPDFPASPQGQLDFVQKLKAIMLENVPGGIGFCYWGAELVAYKGTQATNGSSWENQALFNFENRALPVFDAFKPAE